MNSIKEAMAEILIEDGVLIMSHKDGTKKMMTNYVPKIIAIVKSYDGIVEGVYIEHPPKGTNAELRRLVISDVSIFFYILFFLSFFFHFNYPRTFFD